MQNEQSEMIGLLLCKMKEDSLITEELYEKAIKYLINHTYPDLRES